MRHLLLCFMYALFSSLQPAVSSIAVDALPCVLGKYFYLLLAFQYLCVCRTASVENGAGVGGKCEC